MDTHLLSARELHEKFIEGSLSATQIIQDFFSHIEKIEPETQAFLALFKENALEQAKTLDQKRANKEPLGKLAGVPVGIKDNIHIKNRSTTCASKFLENYTAPFDATVTTLIEQEDGIIIGKTNLDEFAMGSSTEHSAYQKTKNPWNTKCVPGGSSGGSAAAVAARMCPISLGSDTGGSIRQPASFCGTYGFKPTYGRVSRFGLVAFGSSLDQIGPFANSAEDIAMIMEVIGKHCQKDSTSYDKETEEYLHATKTISLENKTVGVPFAFLNTLKPELKALFDQSIETFKQHGAKIVEIDLDILKSSIPVYYILATAEASTNLARFDGIRYGKRSEKAENLREIYELSKEEGFGSEVKRRILLGTYVLSAGYQDAFYKKAQKVRTLIIQAFKKAFETCDTILMPTAPSDAFEIGAILDPLEMYLADIYTICANLAGIPAINVPSGLTEDKKPFGIQLLAPQKQDDLLIALAHQFEKVHNTALTPPMV